VVLLLWVVENRPSPLLWPMAYTTSCTTVQAVIKFGADIFIQSGVMNIFPKLKMANAAILDLFGVSHETTHEGSFVVRTPCKNFIISAK